MGWPFKQKDNSQKEDAKESKADMSKDKKSEPNLVNTAIEIIKTVYDPEIPVNIYDMGLIYEVNLNEEKHVDVVMTLTSPSCPVAESLPLEVEEKIASHPMIKSAKVEIVFDPPWDKSMMSEEAMFELGFM